MWKQLLAVAGGLAGLGASFKVAQALTDEEFPGTDFPRAFREELIDSHWKRNKGYCPECRRKSLRKQDLSVDHRVPIRRHPGLGAARARTDHR